MRIAKGHGKDAATLSPARDPHGQVRPSDPVSQSSNEKTFLIVFCIAAKLQGEDAEQFLFAQLAEHFKRANDLIAMKLFDRVDGRFRYRGRQSKDVAELLGGKLAMIGRGMYLRAAEPFVRADLVSRGFRGSASPVGSTGSAYRIAHDVV